jgi:hypothetical protein
MRFDFRKSVAYDGDAKRKFHDHARRQLRKLAAALGFAGGTYDLRSNRAGIAVSGEITLHAEHLYVQVSQPAFGGDTGIMFRSCEGRKDYLGRPNGFASLDFLHEPNALAQLILAVSRPLTEDPYARARPPPSKVRGQLERG